MKKKISPARLVFLIFDVLIMLFVAFMCFVPVWHLIMSSMSDPTQF